MISRRDVLKFLSALPLVGLLPFKGKPASLPDEERGWIKRNDKLYAQYTATERILTGDIVTSAGEPLKVKLASGTDTILGIALQPVWAGELVTVMVKGRAVLHAWMREADVERIRKRRRKA